MRHVVDRARTLVQDFLRPAPKARAVSALVGLSRDGRAMAVLDASVPSDTRWHWVLVWTRAANGYADIRLVHCSFDDAEQLRLVIPYGTMEADVIRSWVVLLWSGWRLWLLRFDRSEGGAESRLLTAPWTFIPARGESLVYHRGTLTIHRPSCAWASPRHQFFLSPVSEAAAILRTGGSVCRACCGAKT